MRGSGRPEGDGPWREDRGVLVLERDGDDPEMTVCPWGERGTMDCAQYGPANCDGRRCGAIQ
jgi:hypothetical protein